MIKVLIVEDDPMVSMLNTEFCGRTEGLEVIGQAGSIAEAWEYIDQNVPELILLDIYLPGQTGLDFAEELKRKGLFIPILFISAADDIKSIQRAVSFGAVDYLIKPFTYERFQAALRKFISFNEELSKGEVTSQKVLDQYFNMEIKSQIDLPSKKKNQNDFTLPKGISKITMKKVVSQIMVTKEWFTAGKISSEIGISRISTRKYVQFLVEQDFLKEEMDYNTIGRPAIIYQINESSRVSLNQFIYK